MDVGLMMSFARYGWDGMIGRQVWGAAQLKARHSTTQEPITQNKETNHEPRVQLHRC
jgi:hypothetical protein